MAPSWMNSTCTVPNQFAENATVPIVGNYTFYHFNVIISGAAAGTASIIAFALIFLHGTHFSNPAQQIKIIRIIMLIPVYSLYSFFCVLYANAQVSLLPWQDVVEGFALGNFMLLLLELISPHEDQRSLFFVGKDLPGAAEAFGTGGKKKPNAKPKKAIDPLTWYRNKWIFVWQFVLVGIFVGIVTDITEAVGTYCDPSYSPKYAHLWMTIIINVSQTFALTAILLLYQATKSHLATHRPLSKLVAFKGIIAWTFLTGILFLILDSTNAIHPTSTLTYADVKVGIPTLCTLLVMVPFSIFFHYAYSYKFYTIGGRHSLEANKTDIPGYSPSYQGGPLGVRAYLYAMNPIETLQAIAFAFKLLIPSSKDYVRNRAQGPNGAAYSANNSNQNFNNAPNHRPGFEPMRYGEGPTSNDYATNDVSLAPSRDEYAYQPGGYHSVPNIQEPPVSVNYSSYDPAGGRGVSPNRGHSRSPSREQFLPPSGVGRERGASFGEEPGRYGPLEDRERY